MKSTQRIAESSARLGARGSELRRHRTLEPLDLARWVDSNAESLAQVWLANVNSRSGPWNGQLHGLMEHFVTSFVSLLSGCLGPLRAQIDPLWLQASELYGSVAAMRGLAAGDVIEEFQGLREALIRALYHGLPTAGEQNLGLREILSLNRIVDRGVTQASVGHADVLFFALFQGSGLPPSLTPEFLAEVRDQIDAIDAERRDILTVP